MERFTARYPGQSQSLRPMRADLRDWLARNGVAGPRAWDVLLAASEAAANAVDHGRNDRFDVEAVLDGGTLAISVADHGAWRPPLVADAERGRGLAIIRTVATDVEVVGTAAGTTIRMRFPVCRRSEMPLP